MAICCDEDRSTRFCCDCGKQLFKDEIEQEEVERKDDEMV